MRTPVRLFHSGLTLQAVSLVCIAAAVFAVLELLSGFWPGHFIVRARAEPDAFFTYRPWLIAALTIAVTGYLKRAVGIRRSIAGALLTAFCALAAATAAEMVVVALSGHLDILIFARAFLAGSIWALAVSLLTIAFFMLIDDRRVAFAASGVFCVGLLALRPPLPSPVHWLEQAVRPVSGSGGIVLAAGLSGTHSLNVQNHPVPSSTSGPDRGDDAQARSRTGQSSEKAAPIPGVAADGSFASDKRSPAVVAIMTDLPLFWGDGVDEDADGAFSHAHSADTRGELPLRPGNEDAHQAADAFLKRATLRPVVHDVLAEHFTLQPLDSISEEGLAGADVLLLAQPRALHPVELVRVDQWVRAGGAVMLLADPSLKWTEHMHGNTRRAPSRTLLQPLLDHWGLSLAAGQDGPQVIHAQAGALFGAGRIIVEGNGILWARDRSCVVGSHGLIAQCRIGPGRVLVVADADFLRDESWAGPGATGMGRHGRMADNPYFLRGALSDLAGRGAALSRGEYVHWANPQQPGIVVLILSGLLIPLVLLGFGLVIQHRQTGLNTD